MGDAEGKPLTSTAGAISGLRASNLAPAFPEKLSSGLPPELVQAWGSVIPLPWRYRPWFSQGSRDSGSV